MRRGITYALASTVFVGAFFLEPQIYTVEQNTVYAGDHWNRTKSVLGGAVQNWRNKSREEKAKDAAGHIIPTPGARQMIELIDRTNRTPDRSGTSFHETKSS
jgi:hypothetical protein